MSDYLLDSGILILHLRGRQGFLELTRRLSEEAVIHISVVTRLEVVRGMRERERTATFGLLNSFESLAISAEIADKAGELLNDWRSRGVLLDAADALIAATALQHSLALVTTNARHFPMPELLVFQVDEHAQLTLYKSA